MRITITALFCLFALSNCNVFGVVDSGGSPLEKCKALNDAGDYAGAITECDAAIAADATDKEAQLEKADASLASLGIGLASLSDVFLKSTDGTIIIVRLGEALIAAGNINAANTAASKAAAKAAIAAFDAYGALLVAEDPTNGPKVSSFYKTLSRLCYIAVLMAYTDINNATPNGQIEKADICSGAACGTPICINDPASVVYNGPCGGMDDADSLEVGNTLNETKAELATLGLPTISTNMDALAALTVPDPASLPAIVQVPISSVSATYKGDAGREILRQIAR